MIMINVRGRDDDDEKGLELGLGFDSDVEMEVEEGEASSYQHFAHNFDDDNNNNYGFDPDISLSYIDEKLQDVLGHFQKDFEGVVTAENLGAKFGDYGSFLPTYQRAPAWSHLRSPAKSVNHNLSNSNPKVGAQNRDRLIRRCTTGKIGGISVLRPHQINKANEDGVHVLRRHEEASLRKATKKPEEQLLSTQSIMEASAQMGFDNLSTQKIDKIYSELDLELSHSSSLGESPNESPSRILQIMTSFPLLESLLLSPLTECLINLTIKQKKLRRAGKSSVSKKVSRTRETVAVLERETVADTLACGKHIKAASKDTANGENFIINAHLEEANELKEEKAVFFSETHSNVPKGRRAENVEFFDHKAIMREGKTNLQLPVNKENLLFGRYKKPKGAQGRTEIVNSFPEKEMEIPKAVNIYKDLFGDMELDNELDTEKNCTIERQKDDMATEKSKLAPTSQTKKKDKVEKMAMGSMLEENFKSASNVHVSQGDEAKHDKLIKKKVQLAVNHRSIYGLIHSPLVKKVEPSLLSEPNGSGKPIESDIENDTVFEQRGNEGKKQLTENSSKRAQDQNASRVSKKIKMDGLHSREEERGRKSSKKSWLRDKEENGICKTEIDKGKTKIYESSNESMDCTESHEQPQSVKFSKIDTRVVSNKDFADEGAKDDTRVESRTTSGENNVSSVKFGEKSVEKHSLPPSGKSLHLNHGNLKDNGVHNKSISASEVENELQGFKQKDSPNSNGIKPPRNYAASTVLKEAKDLKHLADRYKSTGESTGFYFQAALKFIHGASLLESSSGESAKQNENQAMQIYSSTGKLCGFCAYEYEKSKDMATAALAYKCMEVAYMRVIYSSRGKASRDRLELQTASKIGVPGESPLSSASGIDNLNNPKSDKTKVVLSSPQVADLSNNVISSGDRSSLIRLLSHAQDVNYAMEATRKCKVAFSAANQKPEETKYKEEGIASIKRALDFNFQDVEGLLRFFNLLVLSKLQCIYSADYVQSHLQAEEDELYQNQLETALWLLKKIAAVCFL